MISFRKIFFGTICLFGGTVLFAAGGDVASSSVGLARISAGIAIGLGAFGAAAAQGRAASAALEGIARNPSSKSEVFVPMILSLAFMEFQALLAFAIAGKLAGMF